MASLLGRQAQSAPPGPLPAHPLPASKPDGWHRSSPVIQYAYLCNLFLSHMADTNAKKGRRRKRRIFSLPCMFLPNPSYFKASYNTIIIGIEINVLWGRGLTSGIIRYIATCTCLYPCPYCKSIAMTGVDIGWDEWGLGTWTDAVLRNGPTVTELVPRTILPVDRPISTCSLLVRNYYIFEISPLTFINSPPQLQPMLFLVNYIYFVHQVWRVATVNSPKKTSKFEKNECIIQMHIVAFHVICDVVVVINY